MVKAGLICLLVQGLAFSTGAQKIDLTNPSFEDEPTSGQVPTGWRSRGFDGESPPDIQPGFFNCETRAYDGNTYLGLVVRDNETWEGVGQSLNGQVLKKDSAYTFSLFLSRSPEYLSISRKTMAVASFNEPVILRIWGYNRTTGQEELLAETEPVVKTRWDRYVFVLEPIETDCDELGLEAYYVKNRKEPYNGNLLIDQCSPITLNK